jgi:hypothetical protein
MIEAFTVSILRLFFFFSSVQIAFINENTERYLEKAGLLKITRDICIKKGTVPGNTGRMGTLLCFRCGPHLSSLGAWQSSYIFRFSLSYACHKDHVTLAM